MTKKERKAFTQETLRMYDPILTPENMESVCEEITPMITKLILEQVKKETDEEIRNHPEFGDLHKLLYPSHE